MTDETNNEDESAGTLSLSAILAMASSLPRRTEGIGEILAEVRTDHNAAMKPDLVTVTEPGTGIEKVAYVTVDGVIGIPSSFFDDVREEPLFRRGTATMTSLDSFIAHVNRFGDSDTAIFASDNRSAPALTALLDYHRADTLVVDADDRGERVHGDYRHGKHRTHFAFPLSDEWKAWNGKNKVVMSMIDFAVFLEANMGDIALPEDGVPDGLERFVKTRGGPDMIADYAKLIELSRGLKVHEEATVEEAQTLSSGEGHLRFTVEHRTGRVGAAGEVVRVPTMFFIAIPIFKRGAYYRVAAALNYRKTPDGLKFWFELQRLDHAFDHAFNEAVQRVDAETEATVFFGSPEA